uniref:Uncharacterized protein n=1 Tax=Leersia perrieri TaxID=77586 RepID=A0A0D9WF64_9ORYZ
MPLAYLSDDDTEYHSSPTTGNKKLLLATTAHEAHVHDPATGVLHTVASMPDDERRSCDTPFYLDNRLRLALHQESPVQCPAWNTTM